MAQFTTVNAPAGVITRIENWLAEVYNYSATIPDPATPGATVANTETKNAFAQRMIKARLIEELKDYERTKARRAADDSVTDAAIT